MVQSGPCRSPDGPLRCMHICYLCNEYPPAPHGGIGTVVQTLGRALVRRGHAVTVLGTYAPEWQGRTVDEGIEVVRLPRARTRGTGFVVNGSRTRRALAEIHEKRSIDVLEGSELSLAFLPRRLPYTAVIRMHGGHHFFAVTLGRRPKPWRSWLERRSFARATHLCAVSQFVGHTTRQLIGLGDREIEVIMNPVDVTRFCPPRHPAEDESLILFVGTVCEKKGIRQLTQAMPRIVDRIPHARLLVCGRDSSDSSGGSYTEQLRQTLAAGIADRVLFQGPVTHASLPQVLAEAAVCVYPSHMEALGLASMEALATGKAVVATAAGPGPEVIEDGVSGLLCNPRDPLSIAEQVIAVLADRALRERLGQEARRRAVAHFGLDVLVPRNEAFYRRACNALATDVRPVTNQIPSQA